MENELHSISRRNFSDERDQLVDSRGVQQRGLQDTTVDRLDTRLEPRTGGHSLDARPVGHSLDTRVVLDTRLNIRSGHREGLVDTPRVGHRDDLVDSRAVLDTRLDTRGGHRDDLSGNTRHKFGSGFYSNSLLPDSGLLEDELQYNA